MKRKLFLPLILIPFLILTISRPVTAQQEAALTLRLNKDFGFASGGRIQGTFSMRISGPENLERVEFYVDDQMIGEDTEEPFRLQFNTGSYGTGVHSLVAVGYTTDGQELRSNEVRADFITAEQAGQSTLGIIVPVLVLVFGAILLSALVPLITSRGKTGSVPLGAPRSYGIAGGAICPRCKRPFSRHFAAPNLVLGKLERCPHCGKWSIVPRAHPDALRAAEEAEKQLAQERGEVPTLSEEEKLRQEIEKSRYQDI